MARSFAFEFDLNELVSPREAQDEDFAGEPVALLPLDDRNRPIGAAVTVALPALRHIEGFGQEGEISVTSEFAPLVHAFSLNRKPAHVRIAIADRAAVVPFPERKRRSKRTAVVETVYAGERDLWRLIVVSERFSRKDKARFVKLCELLAGHIATSAPFDTIDPDSGGASFRVDACFVASGPQGLFDTGHDANTRRVFGKPGLVQRLLDDNLIERRRNDMVLVLADLDVRGGAGEMLDENIAWVTPVGEVHDGQLLESWFDIALHEIGHAFELDDEYENPWPGAPRTVMRNVTSDPDPARAPWAALYDAARQEPAAYGFADRNLAPDEIRNHSTESERARFGDRLGMFEGARYLTQGMWRSSLDCKMRQTPQPFCRCCQQIIREAIRENR